MAEGRPVIPNVVHRQLHGFYVLRGGSGNWTTWCGHGSSGTRRTNGVRAHGRDLVAPNRLGGIALEKTADLIHRPRLEHGYPENARGVKHRARHDQRAGREVA